MNKSIRIVSHSLFVVAVFSPVISSAMPTKAELKEAQTIVNELMADDVAALKAGKTNAKAVAEKALGYLDQATTEAAKYLLLQGAFYNFTNAQDFDRAADTVVTLRKTIPDLKVDVLSKMISRALRKGRAGGRLSEMLERLEQEQHYQRLLDDAAKELKANPSDKRLKRMVADYSALTGDWKAALPLFAELGKKEAEVVAFEQGKASKLKALAVGDYWWSHAVPGETESEINAFKVHARAFYRLALKNGEVDGLRRSLIEKRLAEANVDEDPVASLVGGAAEPVLSGKVGKKSLFALDGKTNFELIRCPAGSFTMGRKGETDPTKATYEHKVNLTYSFQMTRYPVTVGQWEAVMGRIPDLLEENRVLGPMAMIETNMTGMVAFCETLNRRFADRLPKGQVFRVPTEAEWEYAFRSGGESSGDPMFDGDFLSRNYCNDGYRPQDESNDLWAHGCTNQEVYERLVKGGISLEKAYANWEKRDPNHKYLKMSKHNALKSSDWSKRGFNGIDGVFHVAVKRKGNAWGFCDYSVGAHKEGTADIYRFDPWGSYASEETNPYRTVARGGCLAVYFPFAYKDHKYRVPQGFPVIYRVVLGPVLKPSPAAK